VEVEAGGMCSSSEQIEIKACVGQHSTSLCNQAKEPSQARAVAKPSQKNQVKPTNQATSPS